MKKLGKLEKLCKKKKFAKSHQKSPEKMENYEKKLQKFCKKKKYEKSRQKSPEKIWKKFGKKSRQKSPEKIWKIWKKKSPKVAGKNMKNLEKYEKFGKILQKKKIRQNSPKVAGKMEKKSLKKSSCDFAFSEWNAPIENGM